MGNSAGGHLVAMLGVSADVPEMSGRLGLHLDMDELMRRRLLWPREPFNHGRPAKHHAS